MDRPFREVHELYKILYERAEAQAAAEKKRKEEEEEKAKNERNKGRSTYKPVSSDVSASTNGIGLQPSPMEAEALEEAFEDMM